jgi:hypothetical protein
MKEKYYGLSVRKTGVCSLIYHQNSKSRSALLKSGWISSVAPDISGDVAILMEAVPAQKVGYIV